MESKINQYFDADINGVKITKESLFYTTEFLLNNLEEKFPDYKMDINNPDFIQDFVHHLDNAYFNADSNITYRDLEHDIQTCIETAQHFSDIEFGTLGKKWDVINEKIHAGKYSSQHINPKEEQEVSEKRISTKQNSFAEQLAEKILAEIEKGTSPFQKPWNSPIPPYNAATGKSYNGANRVQLMFSGFHDPRYMTFNQAKEAGYSIKKGAKGIHLQKYIFEKDVDKLDENGNPVRDENGNVQKEKKRLTTPIVTNFVVFNAEQIAGIPELSLPKQQTWDTNEVAETILKNSGANIIHRLGDTAYYSATRDEIVLPTKKQFPSQEEYYGTALHELSHWTGHESRLNRLNVHAPFGSEEYAREELRAEISSMLLKQDLGIEHNTDRHLSYIEEWSNIIKNAPQEIVRACQEANKIWTYILNYAPEHIKEQLLGKQDHAIATKAEPTVQVPEQKTEIEKSPPKGLER